MNNFESDHYGGKARKPNSSNNWMLVGAISLIGVVTLIGFIVKEVEERRIGDERIAALMRDFQNRQEGRPVENVFTDQEQQQMKLMEEGDPIPYLALSTVEIVRDSEANLMYVSCDVTSRASYATFDSLQMAIYRSDDAASDTATFWIAADLPPRSTRSVVGTTSFNIPGDRFDVRIIEVRSR